MRVTLPLTHRRLFDSFENRCALAVQFRRYRPKLVLGLGEKTPMASPDHWQAMQITDAAIFYSRLTKWDAHFEHLPVHSIKAQLYYTLAFYNLEPMRGTHIVSDISSTVSKKVAAIRCYETQFPKEKEHVFDRVSGWSRHLGEVAGFSAGELLVSPRTLGTRDLMAALFSDVAVAPPPNDPAAPL
jgi:LmbE family N-acetylglucosaminyl deacetylase